MSCRRCGLLVCNCGNTPGCAVPGATTGCSPIAPSRCVADNISSTCQEDHTEQIIIEQYSTTVCPTNSWNVPEEGGEATLFVPGLTSALVGTWIFAPAYGFFQINSFNASTNQIVVVNTGLSDNADPGTVVPACSCFIISSNPCDCNSGGSSSIFPYVAVDFTAPSVGDCANITVTTVNGLQVGKNVGISTGTYRLQAIVNPTTITICNEGSGLLPGTIVRARDGAGNLQYPVVTIDANVCASPAVTAGDVIVCETSQQQPLQSLVPGDAANMVVVALNGVDLHRAQFLPIDTGERTCTVLTSPFLIVNGTANYTINVTSEAGFGVGDIARVQGRSEAFQVTGTGSGTLDITALPTPGADATIPIGSYVCLETCCDRIQTQFDDLFIADNHGSSDFVNHTINTTGGPTTYTTPHVSWTLTNVHPTKSITVLTTFIINAEIDTSGDNISSSYLQVNHELDFTINGGPPQQPGGSLTSTFLDPADDAIRMDVNFTWTNVYTIGPADSAVFDMWVIFDLSTQPAGGGGIADILNTVISAAQIGVPA